MSQWQYVLISEDQAVEAFLLFNELERGAYFTASFSSVSRLNELNPDAVVVEFLPMGGGWRALSPYDD
jgi:hypothetical protein